MAATVATWISDQSDFSYFWSTSQAHASYSGGHLEFPIGTILAIFYLQVTPMLPNKFQANRLFVQEKKQNIDFQDGSHGGHLGLPIRTVLAFLIYKSPWCFLPSFESIGPRGVGGVGF